MWLADVLGRCEGALVYHEPFQGEREALLTAIRDPATADSYIRDFRRKETWLRAMMAGASCRVYGSVNGYLRRHASALKEHIPEANVFHLIRDPRDVVRSMMNRAAFSPPDEFAKACLWWCEENRLLRCCSLPCLRFEDLTASYTVFSEHLLQPLELSLDETTWRICVATKKNASLSEPFPPYDQWSSEQRSHFYRACGPEMRFYGYE